MARRKHLTEPPRPGRKTSQRTRRIALVTFEGGQTLDVTGPLEVFATANRHPAGQYRGRRAAYSIEVLAEKAGPVAMHSGLRLVADRAYASVTRPPDTLVVCGGDVRRAASDEKLLAWLRAMAPRVRRLASVCTGSFILAAAGLLDGRRATTHWAAVEQMRHHFPRTTVEPDALFVRDGDIYTSAGVTSGMDLALALVESDLGRKPALWVARSLVMFLKRPGGQSQFSSILAAQSVEPGALGGLPEWIVEHLDEDLSVERLARRAAMSPRNFARIFSREIGMTPAKFVERARIELARRSLEETSVPIETVARECGFGNSERMRRTFMRHLHVVPHEYRRRFEAA